MNTFIGFLLSGVCHQFPERCMALEGGLLPLCYRCSGMFLALVATLGLLAWLEPRARMLPLRGYRVAVAFLAGLWAVDGLNSAAYALNINWALYVPTNTLRMYTGAGMGLALGIMLLPVARSVWIQDEGTEPVLTQWLHGLIALASIVVLVGAMQYPFPNSLQFWTIVDGLAVVATISLLNTIIVMLATRARPTALARLWSSLAGLALALGEMSALGAIRLLVHF